MGRFGSGKMKNAWEKRLTFLGNSSLSTEESEVYLSSLPPSTGSKDGAVVRALASHQCGPGCNPGVDAICGCWVCCWLKWLVLADIWLFSQLSIYPYLLNLLLTIPAYNSGNEFNKMHLWQNLGTGQNGKTQEVNRNFLPWLYTTTSHLSLPPKWRCMINVEFGVNLRGCLVDFLIRSSFLHISFTIRQFSLISEVERELE